MAGVFNALTTAVSGINAQADAFINLSNNIANSQTTGYKADTTSFQDHVSGSGIAGKATSNTVSATTVQHVDNDGDSANSTNSMAMKLSGNGMFVVSKPSGSASANEVVFSSQKYYTRNGDFTIDKNGYIVNTSGYYLDGFSVDDNGVLTNSLGPLRIHNVEFHPTQTHTVTQQAVVGKVPTDMANYKPEDAQTYTTPSTTVYDSNHNPHNIAAKWTQSESNPLVWNVSVYDADGKGSIETNQYQVTFDPKGSLASIVDGATGEAVGSSVAGAPAEIPIHAKYGNNETLDMTLSLGTIGGKSGTVMATGDNVPSQSQAAPAAIDTAAKKIEMGKTVLGTSTGSNQSYMTSPVAAEGDQSFALKWTQTSSSPPTWSVQGVDPFNPDAAGDVHTVVFDSKGQVTSFDGSDDLGNASITFNGASYSLDVGSASLTTATSMSGDRTALTNDSVTSGKYKNASITTDGSIMAVFDNGYSQLIGKIPVASFNNRNALQAIDGQAYLATADSGTPQLGYIGENGGTALNTGMVEASTTDLTSDLSALIVAQEAYSANTKVITTADTLLQQTIAMKQ
ncbi:flagellar hook-basal body complex protein (plasmid) [Aristophania vespae]|uniref:Flagellar hook protein FlgE n=1 Tax=Aristophania vespae TaxID=2697033 RepID=A0A6P1NCW0_9PROT|nr:flagellar hook-basal body complex protein [Aristophania vespae]QHI96495.1 flagellar hook-basal body complex protein [Aristophania vespae]UMM64819.1 hypothetical protein DM15PD_18390 [Aristophania vespae]